MILHLTRDTPTETTTLGRLSIQYDGALMYAAKGWVKNYTRPALLAFGATCEDEDRGLNQSDPLDTIRARKVKAETAIPAGRYKVQRTWSNRFQRVMPLVLDVPGFAGIRIHHGSTEKHTDGCILVGLTRDIAKQRIGDSDKAIAWLEARIAECERRGEAVEIVITRSG